MSVIDPELKLKLAKAARDLANELEAGTAPKLGFGQLFNHNDGTPCCAMGHVYARAGITPVRHELVDAFFADMKDIPIEATLVSHPVENANDSLAPWLVDATAASRTPLPTALRDYAFAVEGL